MLVISALLIAGAWGKWLPYSMVETLGFVTGASCVYLVVREHPWNFPIGIVSAGLYLVVFLQTKLFGDAALQLVFIMLGFQGWYWWLSGGTGGTELRVTRMSPALTVGSVVFVAAATPALMVVLQLLKGSAPFLDSFTTVLSLAAQYLLNNKKIENWVVWIVADVIYVYLYITRGLHLTAILYAIFLAMCVAGLIEWRKSLLDARPVPESALEPLTHPGPSV
jgi:nicotinamide mononucleotide transporter